VAWALVAARSIVYVAYEQAFFDSDQAIWGLMAKHLIEGRAFPLFCYGQDYMLALDAWVAAPFFAVGGPTVAMLHLSMTFSNLVAVTLLLFGLSRSGVLRPFEALTASLFFTFMPPLIGATLLEPAANVGPFVFVPLLWLLRDRPIWFGFAFAIGFLNREFVAYVVPVLLVMQALDGTLWRPDRVRKWLIAAAVALVTWQIVSGLKPYADMMGPGTRGRLLHGSAGSQIGNLMQRIDVTPSLLPTRAAAMILHHLPRLYGAMRVEDAIANQGRDWMFWPVGLALVYALFRSVAALRKKPVWDSSTAFALYLCGIGVMAATGYVATRDADALIDRYLLLALYLPIGIVALFFATETTRWSRRAMVALMVTWALLSGVDHLHQAQRYWGRRQPNPLRGLEQTLVARGIHVAVAEYWRAYKLTFLSRERIVVASNNVIRIEEYQRLADAEGDRLITIQERSCPGGERVEVWYLCHEAK